MMKNLITFIFLLFMLLFNSCKSKVNKHESNEVNNIDADLSTTKHQSKSWQDSTLGESTIKSLLEKGLHVEPNLYKVTFNTYRKFKNDSIQLRVISSIDKKGHGQIDSLIFSVDKRIHKFRHVNYPFFSPNTLLAFSDNKGINVWFDDYNFDGHPDLAVYNPEASGVKNIVEDIHIYHPERKRYYRNKILSENSNIDVDTVNHTLYAFGQGGMASLIYGSVTYKWQDAELIDIKSVNQIYNDSLDLFIRQIRELKDSVWTTTIDTLTEDKAREWQ